MNPLIQAAITDLKQIDAVMTEYKERLQFNKSVSHLPELPEEVRPFREVKKDYILNAIEICGSIAAAARRLKMTRKTVSNFYYEKRDGYVQKRKLGQKTAER